MFEKRFLVFVKCDELGVCPRLVDASELVEIRDSGDVVSLSRLEPEKNQGDLLLLALWEQTSGDVSNAGNSFRDTLMRILEQAFDAGVIFEQKKKVAVVK